MASEADASKCDETAYVDEHDCDSSFGENVSHPSHYQRESMEDDDRFDAVMDSCKRVGYVRESAMLNGVLCSKCAFCREYGQDLRCELNEVDANPDMFCSRFVDKRVKRTNEGFVV